MKKRFYCPFCDKTYQINNSFKEKKTKCIYCGDNLYAVKIFSLRQLISIITIIAFVTPLSINLYHFILDLNQTKYERFNTKSNN